LLDIAYLGRIPESGFRFSDKIRIKTNIQRADLIQSDRNALYHKPIKNDAISTVKGVEHRAWGSVTRHLNF